MIRFYNIPYRHYAIPKVTKLLEVYVYGEGQTNDKEKNLRGQLYQHYDGSGMQQVNEYDFKGNPLETEQQLLDDPELTDADWDDDPDLSTEIFTSSITYDALNRPVTTTDPGSNLHEFTYDKGGALKTVELNTDDYVNDIHYNPKGQRQAIWYGNGTKTSYTYDEFTFRLRRLLTVNLTTNDILQDLNYWYDPVGNITEIQDDAQQTLFYNNSVVAPSQKFTYDALYRLIEAKGRELIGTANFGAEDNWNDAAWQTTHKGDGNAVQNYTQHYTYDEVGNILELQHVASTGSYTRTYDIDTVTNKLMSTEVGMNTYEYDYDTRGNMMKMPHLSSMVWNMDNELSIIVKGSEPTYYQYSGGQRIRKYTDKGTIKEERIYLGGYEIYRKFDNTSSLILERTTVHISDDTGRIAMLEERTVGTDPSPATLQRYIYSNHLQSASLELDEFGEVISYEEYHPYGTTAYQANNASINAVAKRYRYTGKERDEESGLYYHGARFYASWLCRWVSPDPINSENYNIAKGNPQRNKERDFIELCASPYEYAYDNPVNYNDVSGEQPNKKANTNPYLPPPIDPALKGVYEIPNIDAPKLPKAKEKTPVNVIITITTTQQERDYYKPTVGITESGWDFITVSSMSEAYDKLRTLTSQKGKVDNLILNAHGASGFMSLSGRDYETGKTFREGGWGMDLKMLQNYKKDNNAYGAEVAKQISALDKIGNLMNTDGVCVLNACQLAKGNEGRTFLQAIGNLWENKGTIYASGSFNSDPFRVTRAKINGEIVSSVTLYRDSLIRIGTQRSLGSDVQYQNTSGNGFIKLNRGKIIDFGNTNGNIKVNQNGINEVK